MVRHGEARIFIQGRNNLFNRGAARHSKARYSESRQGTDLKIKPFFGEVGKDVK